MHGIESATVNELKNKPIYKTMCLHMEHPTAVVSTMFALPQVQFDSVTVYSTTDLSDRWTTAEARARYIKAADCFWRKRVFRNTADANSSQTKSARVGSPVWVTDGAQPCLGIFKYIADLIDKRVEPGGGALLFLSNRSFCEPKAIPGFHELMKSRNFAVYCMPGGAHALNVGLRAASADLEKFPRRRRLFLLCQHAYSVGANLQSVANHVFTTCPNEDTRNQQLGRVLRPGQTRDVSATFMWIVDRSNDWCFDVADVWHPQIVKQYSSEIRDSIMLPVDATEPVRLAPDDKNPPNWQVERGTWLVYDSMFKTHVRLFLERYIDHRLATDARPSDLGTIVQQHGTRTLHVNANTLTDFLYDIVTQKIKA